LEVFGRARRPAAARCAAKGRYSPSVSPLRASSRLTVEGARPSASAILRIEVPARRRSAMASRSVSDTNRSWSTFSTGASGCPTVIMPVV
jgi:hypothetical protein